MKLKKQNQTGVIIMRLFIAINLDENIKNKIEDISLELKKSSTQGRFVNKEHMHLTLEFLGETPDDKVQLIKDVMDKVATKPFSMELSRIGYFKRREGNIYWIGVKENEMLLQIQAELHSMLLRQGFDLENREYKPHLTLGRKVKLDGTFNSEKISKNIEGTVINVDKIDLMKSENINGKLAYTVIYSKKL